jgi:sigma-B regulation protein RsbU (phosphoserine phosphatase)
MKRGAQDYLVKGAITGISLRRAIHNAMEKVALQHTVSEQRHELERLYAREKGHRNNLEDHLGTTQDWPRLARAIHQGLLPPAPPALAGYDVAAAMWPAEPTRGDFFAYLPRSDGGLGFALGTGTGPGLGAAVWMASTHAYVQALATLQADVSEILTAVHRFVAANPFRSGPCGTLFVGQLEPASRLFSYASATQAGYWLDGSGGLKSQLDATVAPLGSLPQRATSLIAPIELQPGDLVLMHTGGLTKMRSPSGRQFGLPQVLSVARAQRNAPASAVAAAVFRAARAFAEDVPQHDDITVIVLKVQTREGIDRA